MRVGFLRFMVVLFELDTFQMWLFRKCNRYKSAHTYRPREIWGRIIRSELTVAQIGRDSLSLCILPTR